MAITDADFYALQSQIAEVRRALSQVPLVIPPTTNTVIRLSIIGGNLLNDSVTVGIKLLGAKLPSLTVVYDPDITSTFPDGIGRAWLWVNGSLQAGRVLVVNDGSHSTGKFPYAALANEPCAGESYQMPVDAGGTQTVYFPGLLLAQ